MTRKELAEMLVDFERDVRHALERCHGEPDNRPAAITLTVQ